MIRRLALALVLMWPAAVGALEPVDRFMDAYMTRWHVERGRIAVLHEGRVVYARGYGRAGSAEDPVLLASLTKALTAAAVRALVDDGQLGLDDQLGAIPGALAGLGRPADPRLPEVTVRHLLAHRSGLGGNDPSDPIRRKVAASDPSTARDAVLRAALARKLMAEPGNGYAYSNTGYLLLGRVIETVAGQPYLAFLRRRVLPEEPTLRLDPDWPQLEAAGGVRLSVAAYARFFARAAPSLAADPSPNPTGRAVGFGVMRRGADLYHFGSWNQNRTLALLRGDGVGAVVSFEKRLNAVEPTRDLDESLNRALDEAATVLEAQARPALRPQSVDTKY